ncbi:MAG TPA: fatty acid metabolism transcriptional regulator FadR [Anaerolineaceae bacterium]|nr:fatty acid metabolism transcriptional regulator FadR [Anaerolineaceae bacterium]
MQWDTPAKPAELTEQRIINGILEGLFKINGTLPSERELSYQLGVTRPTLREALQRLSRDGWIEIHQGKPTRIRDYWKEGNLNVLSTIAKYSNKLPENFISNLLQVRLCLCPTYTLMAAQNQPEEIINFLENTPNSSSTPEEFSFYDFSLHQKLTQSSGNPIFTLILNGFMELFIQKAVIYFRNPIAKEHSLTFYKSLLTAIQNNQTHLIFEITTKTMEESIQIWKSAQ